MFHSSEFLPRVATYDNVCKNPSTSVKSSILQLRSEYIYLPSNLLQLLRAKQSPRWRGTWKESRRNRWNSNTSTDPQPSRDLPRHSSDRITRHTSNRLGNRR